VESRPSEKRTSEFASSRRTPKAAMTCDGSSDPAEQAEPQLFAGERGQQRVGEIIDLDQVFEFQVLLPSGQGGSLPARPAHGTTSVAPHPAR